MPTPKSKPEPLPKPSTDADLTNIDSAAYLKIWDQYVIAILEGVSAAHGSDPTHEKQAADYVATLADAMMEERQSRAQGHIDQGIVERAKEKEKASKANK